MNRLASDHQRGRGEKPYRIVDARNGVYAADWSGVDERVGAPQRHNWIIRRAPLIVVAGDLPEWGLMCSERDTTVNPPFFVYGLLRAGVLRAGTIRWLSDAPQHLAVEYAPWEARHRLQTEDGVTLQVTCTAWENHGALLGFEVVTAPDAAVSTELVLEIQGLGVMPHGNGASFIAREHVTWQPVRTTSSGAMASIEMLDGGRVLHVRSTAGGWETTAEGLFLQVPIKPGDRVDLGFSICPGNAAVAFPAFDAVVSDTRKHYQSLMDQCRCCTPDPVLDAALSGAVVTMDHTKDFPAWLEGITRWNTGWANNYQIGAAVAMGRTDEARAALLALAEVERGPGQVLVSDGTATGEEWGWNYDALPYYVLQWDRYNQAGNQPLPTALYDAVRASLDGFMREKDYAGNGLAGWHLGCNSFLYQADHLNLPGAALSPSIMVAQMRRAIADAADAIGAEAEATRQRHAADLVERELMRRFWDPGLGAFVPCLDSFGYAHRRGYYTDMIFPALYGRFSPFVSWLCLESADRRLWTDAGLFRSGDLLPPGFGNSMVGFVQSCEAAEAYAALGRVDRCYPLLAAMALAQTIRTDCPGSSPESCSDIGFGNHAYGFGNPAGAFIIGIIQGLFGVYRAGRGTRVVWRPALPDEWERASLDLSDLNVSIQGTGNRRCYRCEQNRPQALSLHLFCGAHETFAASNAEGEELPIRFMPHPRGRLGMLELSASLRHEVTVERRLNTDTAAALLTVRSGEIDMTIPVAGEWMVEDPCQVLSCHRIEDCRLCATVVPDAAGRSFWLTDPEAGRAIRVRCEGQSPACKASVPPGDADMNEGGTPVDLAAYCNAVTIPGYGGRFAKPSPVRDPADAAVAGFCLPPVERGAVVVEVGELDWATNRLLLPAFPCRVSIPIEARARGISLLAAGWGKVRLTQMLVARLCAIYADGSVSSRDVAWEVAPCDSSAAVLPGPTHAMLAGRNATVLPLALDPTRRLRELVVEVLMPDFRFFIYAMNVHADLQQRMPSGW